MSTILISGANRGLGLEFVRQYAKDGVDIIACCREPASADQLQAIAKAHQNIRVEALNVGDSKSIEALAKKLNGIAIDVLINNAGIFSGASSKASAITGDSTQDFGSIDGEAWDKVLRINTIAPIMVTQTLMPNLLAGNERKVVNITSKMGSIAEMGNGSIAYRSSKAALNAAMRVIVGELKNQGIAIVNLHPGWVKTDMGGASALLEPEASIAGMKKVISGLNADKTGQYLSYDGSAIQW